MTGRGAVADHSVDTIYSAHSTEHLYAHEASVALREFRRVLTPQAFVLLACPALPSVCWLIDVDSLSFSPGR